MARLWSSLSPIDQEKLAGLYKNLTGKDFVPPKEEQGIHLEGKLENLEEIDRLMKENKGVWHD
jgi:hypothetical protein